MVTVHFDRLTAGTLLVRDNRKSQATSDGRYYVRPGATLEEQTVTKAMAEWFKTDVNEYGGSNAKKFSNPWAAFGGTI